MHSQLMLSQHVK